MLAYFSSLHKDRGGNNPFCLSYSILIYCYVSVLMWLSLGDAIEKHLSNWWFTKDFSKKSTPKRESPGLEKALSPQISLLWHTQRYYYFDVNLSKERSHSVISQNFFSLLKRHQLKSFRITAIQKKLANHVIEAFSARHFSRSIKTMMSSCHSFIHLDHIYSIVPICLQSPPDPDHLIWCVWCESFFKNIVFSVQVWHLVKIFHTYSLSFNSVINGVIFAFEFDCALL